MMMTILAPIVVFGLIVLIHEGGHFLTAKLTGMKVEEFAVGFGPQLWSRRRGETLYSLRLFPLGGFNKIMGMAPGESTNPRAFTERPVWQRLLVISAGSLMNILSAFLIFAGLFLAVGVQSFPNTPVIGSVMAGSPAAAAGMQAGDRILAIDGNPVDHWVDMAELLGQRGSHVVSVSLERDGAEKTLSVIPEDQGNGRAMVGITPYMESRSVGIGEALLLGADRCVFVMQAVFAGLSAVVSGQSADVSGPIGVARMAGTVAEVGAVQFLLFIAILSLNLGIMNLFPIPLLDGGLLFLTLGEAILGKKLPERALYYIQTIGITILVGLFLFATYNDLSALGR